ncbi:S8 family serine peptidase [Candidatus Nitrosocosmicus hydrocola]|uniref:S8 family serine peptidase n=1 Tax=Candidatus Nitrosocosmicus hydrocola TaxID=1826872 RepID=UPI0011E59D2B|nr:S8 family serine peptidase [Candidatus Nitrosocosmicus hydrocola]
MVDKALITKRDASRTEESVNAEMNVAEKFGFKVEKKLSHGTLVTMDNKSQLSNLEKEGFRVKIFPDMDVLQIGLSTINVEKNLIDVPNNFSIPSNMLDDWIHYIVFCKQPPNESIIKEIEDAGIDAVEILSQTAIFVVSNSLDIHKLDNYSFIETIIPFQPAFRVDKKLLKFDSIIKNVLIKVYPADQVDKVKEDILQLGGKILTVQESIEKFHDKSTLLVIEISSTHISNLARLLPVRRVEYSEPKPIPDGERESQIVAHNMREYKPFPGYQQWLTTSKLSGEGVVIAICDTGIDKNEKNNLEGHPDIRGRQHAFLDHTEGTDASDTHGHGTHVTGICIGNASTKMRETSSEEDFLWGLGIAPAAKYINCNFISEKARNSNMTYGDIFKKVIDAGAHIINNSWGSPHADPSYNESARTIDSLCCTYNAPSSDNKIVLIFSAGNEGPEFYTLTSPHSAKNPIVVGNSGTVRSRLSEDYRNIASSSSRGPTSDNRIKPDIVAPGTFVSSTWSETGQPEYWTAIDNTENKYVYGCGTSMSAPQISGCCALLIEWWKKKNNGRMPSLPFLKALLINSGENLDGLNGRHDESDDSSKLKPIPNGDQGWGLVNMAKIFMWEDSTNQMQKIYSDQLSIFTKSGQEHSLGLVPFDSNHEMRITLSWIDPPGALDAGTALVNDLDLEVFEKETNTIYKGNVFHHGYSVSGGNFDNLNNVECAYIPNPVGEYEVRIIASNISTDIRSPYNRIPWQPYALVIHNATLIQGSLNGIKVN